MFPDVERLLGPGHLLPYKVLDLTKRSRKCHDSNNIVGHKPLVFSISIYSIQNSLNIGVKLNSDALWHAYFVETRILVSLFLQIGL